MKILRFILKVVILPVILLLTVVELVGIFLSKMGGAVLNLISGALFLLALLAKITGEPWSEALKIMAVSFAFCMVSVFAELLVEGIGKINEKLRRI